MRTAVKDEHELLAPSVGTWFPKVALGAPLAPGDRLGVLRRAGGDLTISAPKGASGVAVRVVPSGTWCAYGESLVSMGDGGGALVAPTVASSRDLPDGVHEICCDIDGTVYLRSEPGAPPLVTPGEAVEALRTVALVEVMKTFTPVRVPQAGTIVAVQVEDGAAVEAGDALFWIRRG